MAHDKFLPPSMRAAALCAAVVALSTAFLPWVRGCGTMLYLYLMLGIGYLIGTLDGPFFWAAVATANVLAFGLPSLCIHALLARRSARASVFAQGAWLLIYLGLLFVLVPAPDCP